MLLLYHNIIISQALFFKKIKKNIRSNDRKFNAYKPCNYLSKHIGITSMNPSMNPSLNFIVMLRFLLFLMSAFLMVSLLLKVWYFKLFPTLTIKTLLLCNFPHKKSSVLSMVEYATLWYVMFWLFRKLIRKKLVIFILHHTVSHKSRLGFMLHGLNRI
jgi:hypothetical protein